MASADAIKAVASVKGSALQMDAAERARAGSRENTPTTVACAMPV
jgi:hypothetical protein